MHLLFKTVFRLHLQTTRMIFTGELDRYKGYHINLKNDTQFKPVSNQLFESSLKESLDQWIQEEYRASWFQIGLNLSQYIPILAKFGYVFHHSKTDYVVMNKWLSKKEPKNIPDYAFTNIGVGGLVIDDKDRVLVVKEKHFFGSKQYWKFPGGYAVQGEDFGQTAVREVLEETGIKCEFQSVISFRHIHKFAFDCSDVYIVCHLKPIKSDNTQQTDSTSNSSNDKESTLKIKKCTFEIDDCQWMTIDELRPQLSKFNTLMIDKYLWYRQNGVQIGLDSIPSIIPNISQQTYAIQKQL